MKSIRIYDRHIAHTSRAIGGNKIPNLICNDIDNQIVGSLKCLVLCFFTFLVHDKLSTMRIERQLRFNWVQTEKGENR